MGNQVRAGEVVMTLPGPTRIITVQPIRRTIPAPQPKERPEPKPERKPEKVPA